MGVGGHDLPSLVAFALCVLPPFADTGVLKGLLVMLLTLVYPGLLLHFCACDSPSLSFIPLFRFMYGDLTTTASSATRRESELEKLWYSSGGANGGFMTKARWRFSGGLVVGPPRGGEAWWRSGAPAVLDMAREMRDGEPHAIGGKLEGNSRRSEMSVGF